MNDFCKLSYFFRSPKYPVIVDVDGALVVARSAKSLYLRLVRFDLVEKKSYDALDKTGEAWALVISQETGVLAPLNFSKPRTKLELIRWFNNRKNKPADEVAYPEKSLSSKKRDRIVAEIADRLADAEKRNASRRK
ncbi:hypothetical protein [Allorhodopirellula solitaria]|uniref:Uncharacterized protein n=1 Tax=Allorhodopirellula solitaria TaxID=2527987 RepID=A0A5C5WQ61_9BACT|nr:hypothetical protein [Allorhodopirellula solitaria]TWT52261.1 hypothetical protein CA85_50410 [Allorhodopirellula solitaria]